jgi:thioester reductase-like protein
MCRIIRGIIQMGAAPDLKQWVNMTPIDYASKAITYLSIQTRSLNKAFHILNPQTLPWNEMVKGIEQFGYPIQRLSYDKWQTKLLKLESTQDNALSPMRSLFAERSKNQLTYLETFLMTSRSFDCQNTLTGLSGTSIACPPIDTRLLNAYLIFFNYSGLLHPPLKDIAALGETT